VETLSRDDLSSRLMLNVDVASVGSLMLPDSLITIMDVSYLKFMYVLENSFITVDIGFSYARERKKHMFFCSSPFCGLAAMARSIWPYMYGYHEILKSSRNIYE
jgi:hypothetical protein